MINEYSKGSRIRYGLNIADRRHLQYIRQRLIAEHGMVCVLCGKPIESENELTIDHIIPRSLGGSTTYGNCQLSHKLCNLRKGNKYIDTENMENTTEINKNGVDKA
jgi:5-methylcytosine-specific restriction endonuclease McrA